MGIIGGLLVRLDSPDDHVHTVGQHGRRLLLVQTTPVKLHSLKIALFSRPISEIPNKINPRNFIALQEISYAFRRL